MAGCGLIIDINITDINYRNRYRYTDINITDMQI